MTLTKTQPDFFAVLTGAQATAAPALQELPMNWEWAKLEDVYKIVGGGTPATANQEFWNGDIPWITSADITDSGEINPRKFITEIGVKNSPINIIPEGAIVIATRVSLGKIAIAPTKLTFSQDCQGLLAEIQVLEPAFALHFLATEAKKFQYISRGTTISGITKKQLSELNVRVPPLLEQKRIVAKLEELLSELEFGVKTLKIALAKVKKYRQSVLKAAVQGDLSKAWREAQGGSLEPASVLLKKVLLERQQKWILEQQAKGRKNAKYTEPQAPDSSGLAELPEGWVWTTAGYICDCIVPNRDKPQSFTGDIPWITIPDFDSSNLHISKAKSGLGLTREEVEKYRARLIPVNSVIMTCVGRFGIAATTKQECVINQQLHAFLFVPELIPEYLTIVLITQKSYMDKKANATTIAYLNKESCNSVPLPLPPLEEQAFIVSQVEAKLSATDHLENSIKANLLRAERLRASTLNMAFRGELVAQDATDEPAAVLLERIRGLRAEAGRKKLPKKSSSP